jgi:hypothetical protein
MRQRGDGIEARGTRVVTVLVLAIATACASTRGVRGCAPARDAGVDAMVDASADGGTDASLTDAAVAPTPIVLPVRRGSFFDQRDAPIRQSLASQAIVSVEHGGAGRSLGFRITLADGTVGYFKPEQTFNGMKWYAEVAAYHLDRELGIGRVAPVVSRRIAWEELREVAEQDQRADEIIVDDEGFVRGAFIWWVPSRPTALHLQDGWEAWLRLDDKPLSITPFVPGDVFAHPIAREITSVPEVDREGRAAEMSDLVVWDYLIHNGDRWGGNFTNIRTVGPVGPLMYLDNAAGFAMRGVSSRASDARLDAVQRYRRSSIDALRGFDIERFQTRLNEEPLAPILDERQIRNLERRRVNLIAHVDVLVEEHGERAIYAW